MVYGPAHRLFAQVMIQRRSLDWNAAAELATKCMSLNKVTEKPLEDFIEEMNQELKVMDLNLRSTIEERKDGDCICLVLVNHMSGEATRSISGFSQQELAFLRLLVSEIMLSKQGELDYNEAINLGQSLRHRMKASMCEKLLERLVIDKWILQNKTDQFAVTVSLSSLILAEIDSYLEEHFVENFTKCFFCTKVTLKGYKCQKCQLSVHENCAKKFWRSSKRTNSCPGEKCDGWLGPISSTNSVEREEEEEDIEEEGLEEEED